MTGLKHWLMYIGGTVDMAMVHRPTRDWQRIRGCTDSEVDMMWHHPIVRSGHPFLRARRVGTGTVEPSS